MSDDSALSALQRKIAQAGEGQQGVAATSFLARALAAAAEATSALPLVVDSCTQHAVAPAVFGDHLPGDGLLAFLAAADGDIGVVAVDAQLLAALIEIQTMGTVRTTPAEARPATRTDIYMCEGFINAVLAFSEESQPDEMLKLFHGFQLEDAITDQRKMLFRLTATNYRLFDLELGLGEGAKSGRMLLCLPGDRQRGGTAANVGRAGSLTWSARLKGALDDSEIRCNMILHRKRMPLSEIYDLKIGDRLDIPIAAIASVEVTGSDGGRVATARLGQVTGRKAVRINGTTGEPVTGGYSAISVGAADADEAVSLAMPDPLPPLEEEAAPFPDAADTPDAPNSELIADMPPLPEPPTAASGSGPDVSTDLSGLPELPDLPPLPVSQEN